MIQHGQGSGGETLAIQYRDADDLLSDYRENLRAGRLYLSTRRRLAVGTRVRVAISFPGLGQPIELGGAVRWLPEGEDRDWLGIELSDEDGRRELAARVARIQAADPAVVSRAVRVLVVEDNPHVARLVQSGLTRGTSPASRDAVFAVTVARNGREALELLERERFELLIVDMYLPVVDGAHVIASVRARPALAGLPVLAVSAGGPQARGAALAAGADLFLDKPMRLRALTSAVHTLLKI